MNNIFRKCEQFIIKAVTGQYIYNFPDNATLRGKRITCIEAPQVANVAHDINGNALVSSNCFKDSYFVGSDGQGRQFMAAVPLKDFDPVVNNGNRLILPGIVFDWPKSSITIANGGTVDNGNSFVLTVWYEDDTLSGSAPARTNC